MQIKTAQGAAHGPRIFRNVIVKLRRWLLIIDAQSSAGVDVVDFVSIRAQVANQVGYASDGLCEWRDVCDLRADMYADPGDLQVSRFSGLGVESARFADRHSELMLAQA